MADYITPQLTVGKLPTGAEYSASVGLSWNGSKIAEIMPFVRHKIRRRTNGEVEDYFLLDIIHNGEVVASAEVKASSKNIDTINLFDIYNGCGINPDSTKARAYLVAIIKHQLSDSTLETIECQGVKETGLAKLNIDGQGFYGFNYGDGVMLPTNISEDLAARVTAAKSEYILKSDTAKYSEFEAVVGMITAISLNKIVGFSVFAFTISALLKSLFRECGIIPKFLLNVCGLKDSLKTAYTSALSPIVNRNDGKSKLIVQFTSSSYTTDNLTNDYKDFPLILDNVYFSESSDITRSIKKKFEEAAQIIGDDIGKGRSGKIYNPAASIITTSENDGIGNPSTVARYLTIPVGDALRNPLAQSVLHEFQNDKFLIIPTYYRYLLQWILDNAERIKASIKDLLTDFREAGSSIDVSTKLRERYFILLTAYMIFLSYCDAKGFANIDGIMPLNEFSDMLLCLCRRHNRTIVEKESAERPADADYVKLIRHWLESKQFNMAKDEHDAKLKSREALVYNGCLCLRTEALMRKINKTFPNAKLKDVVAQLVAKNVLKSDADKNTGKIKGIRFLKIPLKKLKKVS